MTSYERYQMTRAIIEGLLWIGFVAWGGTMLWERGEYVGAGLLLLGALAAFVWFVARVRGTLRETRASAERRRQRRLERELRRAASRQSAP